MNNNSELKLVLIASLLLIVLLPLGLAGFVTSAAFKLIFLLHIILLALACFLCFKKILQKIAAYSVVPKALAFGSLLICLYFCLPGLLLPVTARDALIHHLAIPKIWIQTGSIAQISWHEWSYYPMLIQLAFTGILQLAVEQLCSVYIFLYLPIFIYSLIYLSEKLSDSKLSVILIVILALTLPVLLKLSSAPMVDLPLALFCTLALSFLYELSTEKSQKPVIYAGLALGLALGTKLNAIPFVLFAILAFLAIQWDRSISFKSKLIALIKVCLIALMVFSPWLIKNYLWTSNPLYPYANSIFGSQLDRPDSGLTGLNPLQQRLMLYGESAWQVIFLPVRLFFEGREDNPQFFDGVFSPLLLMGLVFALSSINKQKVRALTFIALAVIIFSLLSTGARIRYLAPIYSVLIILTAHGLSGLKESSKFSNVIVNAALILQILFSTDYVIKQTEFNKAYQYLNAKLTKDDYLSHKVPEFPVIAYCNTNLPKDTKLYLIYTGNQFYLYSSETFSSGHTSADHLLSWIRNSQDTEELIGYIKKEKITHFVLNDMRLYQILQTSLSPEQKKIWNQFYSQDLEKLYQDRGFSVLMVK